MMMALSRDGSSNEGSGWGWLHTLCCLPGFVCLGPGGGVGTPPVEDVGRFLETALV